MSVFEIFNIYPCITIIRLYGESDYYALRYEKLDRHHIMPGCQEMMH